MEQSILETVQGPAAGIAQGTLNEAWRLPSPLQQTVSCAKSPQVKMSDHCQQPGPIFTMWRDCLISDRHNPRPTTGRSHSFPNLSQQLTGPAVVVLVEVVVDEVVDVDVVVGAGVVVVGA